MKSYILLGASLALAACGSVTEPVPETALAPAANPDPQIRHSTTANLLSGFVKRPVTGPASWRELNEQQTPGRGGS